MKAFDDTAGRGKRKNQSRGPIQTSNFTCTEPSINWVDSNVEPNLVELYCKTKHGTTATAEIADQNGRKECGKDKLWK